MADKFIRTTSINKILKMKSRKKIIQKKENNNFLSNI